MPAQQTNDEILNCNHLEDLIEQDENFSDDYSYEEQLNYLQKNPIDVNTNDSLQWLQIPFLTIHQVSAILEYRKKYGDFLSINELTAVQGLNSYLVEQLKPFVTITNRTIENANDKTVHKLMLYAGRTIEKQKGFNSIIDSADSGSTRYLGNPYKVKMLYNYSHAKIQAGMLVEKDAGEPYFNRYTTTFDYTSGYIEYTDKNKFLQHLIIGNYTATAGQGLVMAGGTEIFQHPVYGNFYKFKNGLRRYTSFNEYKALQGIGLTMGNQTFSWSNFISLRSKDATVSRYDSTGGILAISNLQTDGIHATSNDLKSKNNIKEWSAGSILAVNIRNFQIGLSYSGIKYSVPFDSIPEPYKQYAFRGQYNHAGSFFYRYTGRSFVYFGEFAANINKAKAVITGLVLYPEGRININLLYRKYDMNYTAPYSQAYSQNSSVNNEEGWLIGLTGDIFEKFSFSAYADYFYFPWLKYQVNKPSNGMAYYLIGSYSDNRFQIKLQYRRKTSFENKATDDNKTIIDAIQVENQKFQISGAFSLTDRLTLKNRLDFCWYYKSTVSRGLALQQNIDYAIFKKYSISLSCSYFSTDDWNSRIYVYEKNVPYNYALPALYGKGTRYYVLLKYYVKKDFQAAVKYAVTRYSNRYVIGSGLSEINGNKQSNIDFEVLYRF